jgi:hypothetical protein
MFGTCVSRPTDNLPTYTHLTPAQQYLQWVNSPQNPSNRDQDVAGLAGDDVDFTFLRRCNPVKGSTRMHDARKATCDITVLMSQHGKGNKTGDPNPHDKVEYDKMRSGDPRYDPKAATRYKRWLRTQGKAAGDVRSRHNRGGSSR